MYKAVNFSWLENLQPCVYIKILESLNGFLFDRGLQLSEQKTKIVDVDDGFDFLSRHYERKNGIVVVSPADYAVTRFENELEELILNHKGSQKALIDKLNSKLTGWASYHKLSNAFMAFRRIDVFVKANLIKLCEMKHPTWSIESLNSLTIIFKNAPKTQSLLHSKK